MSRNPLKLYGGWRRLENLKGLFDELTHRPPIGVTQGGSSRKDSGAISAASAKATGSASGSGSGEGPATKPGAT